MTGNELQASVAALQRALDELGAPSMIIGGIAVIASGIARLTTDVDATIAGSAVTPERALEQSERLDVLEDLLQRAGLA